MKKLLLGGPGSGKTTHLVNATVQAKSNQQKCLFLSYNVRNVLSAQQRAGLSQKDCRSIYAFTLAIYRDIAIARHMPVRELIDEGVCRFLARKAIVEAKKHIFLNNVRANMRMAQELVELTERYIHKTNEIPVDTDTIIANAKAYGLNDRYGYELYKVLPTYMETVRREGAILFCEMLCIVVQTHKRYPTFIERITSEVSLVMVDEIQDLTFLEFELIKGIIKSVSSDIILAGDFNQCVTQYRGANPNQLIESITELGFEVEQLTSSYRFGSHIGHFASVYQQHSHSVCCQSDRYTRLNILHEGVNLKETSHGNSKALLTRTKEQSLVYQFWLESKGMNVIVNDGYYWKESQVFQALLGWAVMVTDFDVDQLPYLKAKSMIRTLLYYPYRSANDEVINVLTNEDPKTAFNGLTAASELGASSLGGLPYFLLKAKSQLQPNCTFHEFLSVIMNNQHFHVEVNARRKSYSPLAHLHTLMEGSDVKLTDFISLMAALTLNPNAQQVEVMTLHSSKGLEFDDVILAGLHKSCIPLPTDTIEEAESLFYVGMTRAKHNLTLIVPKQGCTPLIQKMIKVGKIA
ncbi:hypothetical protein VIBNIFTn2_120178 [Vibrio nigripulchritudo FTn2]|uniref:3'-5' exonuclease n=1 Tax=Vibrio nigripulchritudo TaxID=28173 RepID=UPI0003B1B7A0|nr:ATP-dependent helicase [Vibrio nigripulchritudo]CCN40196.1 hypothetical protein VIBNIFTn2_120178 [Vibrio nigripulchritudo FTn2]